MSIPADQTKHIDPRRPRRRVIVAVYLLAISAGLSLVVDLPTVAMPFWPGKSGDTVSEADKEKAERAAADKARADEEKSEKDKAREAKAEVKKKARQSRLEEVEDAAPAVKAVRKNEVASPSQAVKEGAATDSGAKKKPADGTAEQTLPVPLDFVPAIKTNTSESAPPISVIVTKRDPLAVYRASGISPIEERKIRQLAGEYEGMQRVRLKLLDNLLAEMRAFQFESEPDAKTVLAKQDEINKLSTLMANERVKLLLAIRDVMTHDEKLRLVDELQREASGLTPQK